MTFVITENFLKAGITLEACFTVVHCNLNINCQISLQTYHINPDKSKFSQKITMEVILALWITVPEIRKFQFAQKVQMSRK